MIVKWRPAEGEHKDLWQREAVSTCKQEVSNPVPDTLRSESGGIYNCCKAGEVQQCPCQVTHDWMTPVDQAWGKVRIKHNRTVPPGPCRGRWVSCRCQRVPSQRSCSWSAHQGPCRRNLCCRPPSSPACTSQAVGAQGYWAEMYLSALVQPGKCAPHLIHVPAEKQS